MPRTVLNQLLSSGQGMQVEIETSQRKTIISVFDSTVAAVANVLVSCRDISPAAVYTLMAMVLTEEISFLLETAVAE